MAKKIVGYAVEIPQETTEALVLGLVLHHRDEGGITEEEIVRRVRKVVESDAHRAFQVVAGAVALNEEPPARVGMFNTRAVDVDEAERLQQELTAKS